MGRGHETFCVYVLSFVARSRAVNKHPYQPHQCRDTDNCINDIAGQRCRSKQKRDQVKTKDTNQPPVQGADECQWYKNIVCQSSHLFSPFQDSLMSYVSLI